jgi:acyl-CoA synthetase (AMP-forming)/AMP-acid ligase II
MLSKYNSIVEILQQKAIAYPQAIAYIFLADGENQEVKLSYSELDFRAKAIAIELKSRVKEGYRALLVYGYNDALEFISAFMGCLYAGVIAVPCHPPMNRLTITEVQTRLVDAEAKIVLSNSDLLTQLKKQLSQLEERKLDWLDTQKISETSVSNYHLPLIDGDSLAFLQYTSGSTGEPKGVIITHRCLLQNQEMLRLAFGHNEHSVGVGWLPLFHDMGLIGNVIQPIYLGICCILLSPIAFVQKPIRWLQAISKYRATTSGAPNFAYDLLWERIEESKLKQLDLSSWKVAFCGAEPVQQSTIDRFSQKFAVCSFQKSAFYPCYGMAEATLMITGGDYQKPPNIKYVDKLALTKNQVIITHENQPGTTTLVSAGYPWLDSKLAIVNPQTNQECPSNEIGEIWFSGSSIGQGYWQKSQATQKTFQAILDNRQFLRTGDLGFIADGELYITGRLNDVLVFWGFNHYPQQIEQTVTQAHEALKANGGAAFSITVKGKERLVIVQEIKRNYRKSFVLEDVVEAIRWEVFQQHFIDVYAIVLLTPGSLPKTSSGKVQRSACKTKFLNQSLSVMAQWSLADAQPSDVTSLMERYTNPFTYLKIILAVIKGKLKHFFYLIKKVE